MSNLFVLDIDSLVNERGRRFLTAVFKWLKERGEQIAYVSLEDYEDQVGLKIVAAGLPAPDLIILRSIEDDVHLLQSGAWAELERAGRLPILIEVRHLRFAFSETALAIVAAGTKEVPLRCYEAFTERDLVNVGSAIEAIRRVVYSAEMVR